MSENYCKRVQIEYEKIWDGKSCKTNERERFQKRITKQFDKLFYINFNLNFTIAVEWVSQLIPLQCNSIHTTVE